MISFAEAVVAVRARREHDWGATPGTPFVSPEGFQDEEDFLVVWGAREYLIDDDLGFLLFSNTSTLVSRETGEVRDVPTSENLARLAAMTPVATTAATGAGRCAPPECPPTACSCR